jgi:hypothetical protein
MKNDSLSPIIRFGLILFGAIFILGVIRSLKINNLESMFKIWVSILIILGIILVLFISKKDK